MIDGARIHGGKEGIQEGKSQAAVLLLFCDGPSDVGGQECFLMRALAQGQRKDNKRPVSLTACFRRRVGYL
jgi:hypothetical protein